MKDSLLSIRNQVRKELAKWDRLEVETKSGKLVDYIPVDIVLEHVPRAIFNYLEDTKEAK